MEFSTLKDINLSSELEKDRKLTRLESEFQELKNKKLILKEQGNTGEYENIKEELKDNIKKREHIYWG